MTKNFKIYSKYYDLLYKDKDYHSEANYVAKQLKLFVPKAKSILEFGSGTGGHGVLLQKKGFDVFGLDQSEEMVAEAKKRGLPCQTADISRFKLKQKYDAVISLFHVIGYLTNNKDLTATFQNAYKHLNKDGVFLFDLWYSPAVYEQKAVTRLKKIQNKEVAVTRIAEPHIDINNNIVDVRYTIFIKDIPTGKISEFEESHPVRHFSAPEIGLLAKLTGFEVIKSEEFLTGNQPSASTWGVCFILRKI
jgi:SAM-dependent methyltransferase